MIPKLLLRAHLYLSLAPLPPSLLPHPQQFQNLTLLIPHHRPPIPPIHHHRPNKQLPILLNLPQRITLTRRLVHQQPGLPLPHILEYAPQLVRRGIRLCHLKVEGVGAFSGGVGLRGVVRGLVFGGVLGDLGGGLFEDGLGAGRWRGRRVCGRG